MQEEEERRAHPGSLRLFAWIVLLFVAWRGSLFVLDFVGASLTFERSPNPYQSGFRAFPDHWYLDAWFRWDAKWYKRIAEEGYRWQEGEQSSVAFFPLFPYLARYLGKIVGNHLIAGLILSNTCTLFALYYMFRLGVSRLGEAKAKSALIFLLIFPGSFFFSSYYPEGLFLLATCASTCSFFERRFFLAGTWGLLATLTRPTGILLFLALVAGHVYDSWKQRQKIRGEALWLALIPAGLLLYMLFLYQQFGDPLVFARAQAGWGRSAQFPLASLFEALARVNYRFPRSSTNMHALVEALCALSFLIVSILMIRRFHPTLWLIVMLGVLVPLTSGGVMSMVRHASVLFPVFYYVADVTEDRPLVARFAVFVSTFLLCVYNLRFVNWYWAG
ncbi:MAG: hypothetical protein HY698_04395 [Deltaproteobacteria bacterium]|nr:hypothetical protein [Deltaproteobacteria bacterium]